MPVTPCASASALSKATANASRISKALSLPARTAAWGSNFTVRKMSFGEGVERVFPLYSPIIDSITVVRRGIVRRAKLYYLRGRSGKSARIAEKSDDTRMRAKGAPDEPKSPQTEAPEVAAAPAEETAKGAKGGKKKAAKAKAGDKDKT